MPSPQNNFCLRPAIAGLLLLLIALPGAARKVRLKVEEAAIDTVQVAPPRYSAETIDEMASKVTVSGYDKTRDANKESIFVTNGSLLSLRTLVIEIEYQSMDGRQLHRRRVKINCNIPPGETRRLDFASWDKQHTFYYHLSPKPARSPATPYRATARIISVTPE